MFPGLSRGWLGPYGWGPKHSQKQPKIVKNSFKQKHVFSISNEIHAEKMKGGGAIGSQP